MSTVLCVAYIELKLNYIWGDLSMSDWPLVIRFRQNLNNRRDRPDGWTRW
jgi:hypothetical protein